ncbi:chromate resistance protein ChrB domain-containing protein [Chitinophaga barathri]|uniref:Helix-turn-helix domain-containing protein n=1 Tax=Chitinophaga barathri TaxID=1647451 RepID=A0A3N4MJD5_9BACT|nr:chromate resistance protein ChrB domain-containing protein [Chitinophaga barathri]RPD41947.1 helix-turn-helix domain-containing protein [Chitinophaga barathri]
MKWVTLHRPKIDHIACSWFILRFINPNAEILFVSYEEVNDFIGRDDVMLFDIKGAEYTTLNNDGCMFDVFVRKHQPENPALEEIAHIVRGAVTGSFHFAPQSAGLWAVVMGIAYNVHSDAEFLQQSLAVFDGLLTWETRFRKPLHKYSEYKLMEVFHRFITQKYGDRAKKPVWVKEIAAIVQDEIDTSLSLDLAALSEKLPANPGSLIPYPDFHTFGEEIRRRRIEKAMQLMEEDKYSLTEVAYITGFSDLGHFSRIFSEHYGKTPTGHLKTIRAQKNKEEEE